MLVRAGSLRGALAPGLGVGAFLLVIALVFGVPTLGTALWLAGATYVGFLAGDHRPLDEWSPVVAVLLLLCGELAAWSVDERWRLKTDWTLHLRRGVAVAVLAVAGLAVAAFVIALTAAPSSHGLIWTALGAAAAVGATGAGIALARR